MHAIAEPPPPYAIRRRQHVQQLLIRGLQHGKPFCGGQSLPIEHAGGKVVPAVGGIVHLRLSVHRDPCPAASPGQG